MRYTEVMFTRLVVFAAVVFSTQLAWGQFMPGQIAGRGMIAMNPDCAKELKITKEQQKKFEQALKDMQTRMAAGDYSGIDITNPFSAIDTGLETVLDDAQKARLEELFIQKNEGLALTDKHVAAKMELSEEQIAEINRIDKESKPELTKIMQNMRSNSDVNKIKAKQKEISLLLLAVLLPAQTEKFELLKGKPFKFK